MNKQYSIFISKRTMMKTIYFTFLALAFLDMLQGCWFGFIAFGLLAAYGLWSKWMQIIAELENEDI